MKIKVLAVLLILALVGVAGVYAQTASQTVLTTPKPAIVYEPPSEAIYDLGGGNVYTFTDPKKLNDFIRIQSEKSATSQNIVMKSTKPQPDQATFSQAKLNLSDWPVNSVVWASDDGKAAVGFYPGVLWFSNGTTIDSPNADHGLIISNGEKIPIQYKFTGKWLEPGNLDWYFEITDQNGQVYHFKYFGEASDVDKIWYCSLWPGVMLKESNQVPTIMYLEAKTT